MATTTTTTAARYNLTCVCACVWGGVATSCVCNFLSASVCVCECVSVCWCVWGRIQSNFHNFRIVYLINSAQRFSFTSCSKCVCVCVCVNVCVCGCVRAIVLAYLLDLLRYSQLFCGNYSKPHTSHPPSTPSHTHTHTLCRLPGHR